MRSFPLSRFELFLDLFIIISCLFYYFLFCPAVLHDPGQVARVPPRATRSHGGLVQRLLGAAGVHFGAECSLLRRRCGWVKKKLQNNKK